MDAHKLMTEHPLRGDIVRVLLAHNRSLKDPVPGHLVEERIVNCGLLPKNKPSAEDDARGHS
jgi:hypothetical protein